MPTYAELEREPWWGAEYIPPNLRTLVGRLQKFYGLGWTHIGSKGDNRHLRGYHRSRNWILNSVYCTNRTYSVSRTPGDRSGGDGNWLCAIDATLPRDKLLAACKRLDSAVRAGRLEKITEWYGNTDGDDRVDGYDNISNRVATSDSSHLWHLHISFDRGRANEDHTDLYEILTGDDMPTVNELLKADVVPWDDDKNYSVGGALWDAAAFARLNSAKLDAVLAALKGDDSAEILAAIEAQGTATRAALADLGPAITAAVLAGVDAELDEEQVGAAVAQALAARLAQ